jgi:hypothetical protein
VQEVCDVLRAIANARKVEIVSSCDPSVEEAFFDPVRFKQVWVSAITTRGEEEGKAKYTQTKIRRCSHGLLQGQGAESTAEFVPPAMGIIGENDPVSLPARTDVGWLTAIRWG